MKVNVEELNEEISPKRISYKVTSKSSRSLILVKRAWEKNCNGIRKTKE